MRVAMALTGLGAMLATPVFADGLSGVYNTGRSEIETEEAGTLDVAFHPCAEDGARYCGTIVAVNEPEPTGRDTLPDGSPLVGFVMIRDLEPRGDGRFRDGKVNAIDESMRKEKMIWYGVKIDDEGDRLKVKGCLGPICPRTLYWARVADVPVDTVSRETETVAGE